MQRRPPTKSRTPLPPKRKHSPPKPKSPPKPHRKMPKALLTGGRQAGSKRSIPRQSCGNALFHSVGELPLQNQELKERLLERALRADKSSSAHEESLRTRNHCHPNGEYFGTTHSILPHLDNSRHSRGSKHSKRSKDSKGSKGSQGSLNSKDSLKSKESLKSKASSSSLIQEKMLQYRALESKHSQ